MSVAMTSESDSRLTIDTSDPLMTPGEVAALFRVTTKTVGRWARSGRLRCIRTPHGRLRFVRSDMEALVADHLPPS